MRLEERLCGTPGSPAGVEALLWMLLPFTVAVEGLCDSMSLARPNPQADELPFPNRPDYGCRETPSSGLPGTKNNFLQTICKYQKGQYYENDCAMSLFLLLT